MAKDKRPRKPKKPVRARKAAPQRARADIVLVPQARRAPPAAGGDVPSRQRPVVDRLLRLLRATAGAMLDVADAAAGAIMKARAGRG